MSENTISILEGNTFVVSDRRGNIDASPTSPTGLFSWDTRFLSRWILTVDGKQLSILSTDELDSYFSAQFFLAPGTGTTYVDADISVIRKRSVGEGFHEDLTIANHRDQPVDLQVRIDIAADFADLFEEEPAKLRDWKPTNPLFGLENVIITPHAAYYSEEAIRTVRDFAAQEVVRVLTGNAPLSPVNAARLSHAHSGSSS
jgi:glycogen debranching enzyme